MTYVPHDTILCQEVYSLDTFRGLGHLGSEYMLEDWALVSCFRFMTDINLAE
jgi:hypothetical protein